MSKLNLLYCSGCKCPRSIFQYPMTSNGIRASTCVTCHDRHKLAYRKQEQEGHEQEDEQEESIAQSIG
jgi:hypothetical protein